ncbi:MAG: hypothetical protein WBG48_17690 [Pricia sp.]
MIPSKLKFALSLFAMIIALGLLAVSGHELFEVYQSLVYLLVASFAVLSKVVERS